MTGIYKITSPSGKIYIGQSKNILNRFRVYRRLSCKKQPRLYSSFISHGVDNHLFEIIEECDHSLIKEKEALYISMYKSYDKNGLNCMGGMTREGINCGHSKETRDKISRSKKGHISKLKGRYIARKNSGNARKPSVSKNLVFDSYYGIYYNSVSDAARCNNLKVPTLRSYLFGTRTNKKPNLYFC